jgi:prepilin peptidase CpaA
MVIEGLKLFFPGVMAYAAFSDLFTMRISNRLSSALVLGFVAVAAVSGLSMTEIGVHVGAATLVLSISFVLFTQGWIGGGDAKLAAATALWLGFEHLLPYLLYASLFGGVLSLVILLFRRWPLPMYLAQKAWIHRLHEASAGVPYGIALAAAAVITYSQIDWMAPA